MTTNQLRLRTIDELREESFHVPAYQRGYRWTKTQVTELLEDVWDFVRSRSKSKEEFYCLQPIVVAPLSNKSWEVVDGQQRLTTLYLVLSFFNERFTEPYRKSLYKIDYETRPNSAAFLKDIRPERQNENIDFLHMAAAGNAIREWFLDKTVHVNDIESAFLLNVKVIWYELEQHAKPLEVFQRLNIGKIPLTEGELVKALFLRAANFSGDENRLLQLRQMQIAHEWDAIERRLQEDDFWYFLTNQHRESNRIEFILELRAEQIKRPDGRQWRGSDIFHVFLQRLSEPGAQAWSEWEYVKQTMLSIEDWFRDDTLHHLVGFLASRETADPHAAIKDVAGLAEKSPNKSAFRRGLKGEIFSRVFRSQMSKIDVPTTDLSTFIQHVIGNLDYASDPMVIRNVLLLFNLVSMLESDAGARFPFGVFKREKWDIEHIRSVNSRMPQRIDEQKRWLATFEGYLGAEERRDPIESDVEDLRQEFIAQARALRGSEKFDGTAFALYFQRVQQVYDPYQNPEADNSIGNLTLLDAKTNRGYGNAIFPIKRETIIALDKVGKFVPLCTKNVFLKYYSHSVDRMLVWDRIDTEAHASAICDSLTKFFADKETL